MFLEWAGRKVERGRHPFKNTQCSPALQAGAGGGGAGPLPAHQIQECRGLLGAGTSSVVSGLCAEPVGAILGGPLPPDMKQASLLSPVEKQKSQSRQTPPPTPTRGLVLALLWTYCVTGVGPCSLESLSIKGTTDLALVTPPTPSPHPGSSLD